MGKGLCGAGLIGYQGIKFNHAPTDEAPKMIRQLSLTELIQEEYKKGISVERLARAYGLSSEEISKMIKGENSVEETIANKTQKRTDESPGDVIRKGIKAHMEQYGKDQLAIVEVREIAKTLNKDVRTVSIIASKMGVYEKQAKPKAQEPAKEEAAQEILASAVEVPVLKEFKLDNQTTELQEIKGILKYEIWVDRERDTRSEIYEGDVSDIITLLRWQGRLSKDVS